MFMEPEMGSHFPGLSEKKRVLRECLSSVPGIYISGQWFIWAEIEIEAEDIDREETPS